jgi:hypothetical protein
VDGYKRHVLHDLDTGLIRAVGITPANVPEASVTPEISADLEQQGVKIKELHIDRGYLSSHLVRERSEEMDIYCKAGPFEPANTFTSRRMCWTGTSSPSTVPLAYLYRLFPVAQSISPKTPVQKSSLRAQCTTSTKGRSVSIHPDEALLLELRQQQQTPEGRPNCVNGLLSNTRWPMLVGGKADVPATGGNARISSICAAAPWSTTCTFWLVPSHFKLIFRKRRDFSTGSLAKQRTPCGRPNMAFSVL